jgi:hypothetical protein
VIKLNLDSPDNRVVTEIRSRLNNVYSRIAADDDYQRNLGKLGLVQFCVITVSAVATGVTNAFAHRDKLGVAGAIILALLIMSFVEVFYFVLRHGLATVYKGMQRLAAETCYRIIQGTMVLNAAVLCAWVVGIQMPPLLALWNRWSIVVHFTLALVGVSAVRDSDPVTANKILELKAETAKQDLITIRKAAALGNPVVMLAAKMRGLMDGFSLARQILSDSTGSSSDHGVEIDELGGRDNLFLPSGQAGGSNVADLGKHRRR